VSDCNDLSKWQARRPITGKVMPLPTNHPKRYVAMAKAERFDGRWVIVDYTPHGEQTCWGTPRPPWRPRLWVLSDGVLCDAPPHSSCQW
jgi:hypothetical protein